MSADQSTRALVLEIQSTRALVLEIQSTRALVLEIQSFLAVMVSSTLILSAVVTDRKRAFAELARSEERFRLAIEAVGDGAYDYDVPTGEVRVTDRWLLSLGYPSHENRHTIDFWMSLIHGEDKARVLRELQRHLEGSYGPFRVGVSFAKAIRQASLDSRSRPGGDADPRLRSTPHGGHGRRH